MPGIPGELLNEIHNALAECAPVQDDQALRYLFVDSRIAPWRNGLPQAASIDRRVHAVTAFLSEKQNSAGENALFLLLRVLAEGTDEQDSCHQTLVGLAERLHSAVSSAEPAGDARRLRVLPTRLHRKLLGRSQELAGVPPLLNQGTNHYYYGSYGVGKTSLTIALFHQIAAEEGPFTDGYLWLDVGRTGVESVLELIASRFNDTRVARARGYEDKVNALRELLAGRRLLIGLDDVQDRRVAEAVLEAAGNCTVLVNGTQPLATGRLATLAELKPLATELACELFVSDAGLDPSRLTPAEKRQVTHLCETLGNLPLAVHLAARQVAQGITLEGLQRRLAYAPQQLASAEIREMFNIVYEKVSTNPTALRLLARLVSFPAKEASEAALLVQIAPADYYLGETVLQESGLVTTRPGGRLVLHALLGRMARQRLAAENQQLLAAEQAQAHTWLLDFARRHQHHYDTLDQEHRNLVGLLEELYE